MKKIVYLKGGNAITDANRLLAKKGEIISRGPDQYFINTMNVFDDYSMHLITVNENFINQNYPEHNAQATTIALRPKGQSLLMKPINYVKGLLSLYNIVRNEKPEIILSGVEGVVGACACAIAKKLGIPFIFSAHNALNITSTSFLNKQANRYLAHSAASFVAHGPFIRDQLLSLSANPNHIFEFLTSTVVERDVNKSKTKTIIYCGRMERDKGIFDLVNAFINSTLFNLNYQIIFIGEGSDLVELKNYVKQTNLDDKVIFLGKIPHQEVFSYMTEATFVATPTQSSFPEGRCMSAVEAILCGTPVIAPNYGPFPYLIQHGHNGLLYDADNVEALTQAIDQINDKNLYDKLIEGVNLDIKNLTKPHKVFKEALEEAKVNAIGA